VYPVAADSERIHFGRHVRGQGLDPEFIKKLEKQFGFDKPAPERFAIMLWNWAIDAFTKLNTAFIQGGIAATAAMIWPGRASAQLMTAMPRQIIAAVAAFGSMLVGWIGDAWNWAVNTQATVAIAILNWVIAGLGLELVRLHALR